MTQFKRQIVASVVAGLLTLTSGPSVFAATTLEISGNGSSSDNDVKVARSSETTVVQSNSANVTNNVSSNSSTGGNKANYNTNGDVMIRTGDASSDVTVKNTLNSNTAKVDCCDQGDITAKISGNGSDSDNNIDLGSGRYHAGDKTEIQVFQDNNANVNNYVDSHAKTGDNDANRNTNGDVTVRTGDATATADVSTTANANVAQIGGHGSEGNTVSALITGNGSKSDNSVDLDLDHATSIVQDNLAHVKNNVDAKAKTGYNDANDNTSGEVAILTGDAEAGATVDNMVNFNAADIDCGCLLDATAKVSGNGYDSENTIKAKLGEDRSVFQGGKEGDGNKAYLDNGVDTEAQTGKNDAKFSTGDTEDPFIWTGDASSWNQVENTGNSNVYGDMPAWWPDVQWDFSFSHFWNM